MDIRLFFGTFAVYTSEIGNDDYGEYLDAMYIQDVDKFVKDHEKEVNSHPDRYFILELCPWTGSGWSYQFHDYESFRELPIFTRGI